MNRGPRLIRMSAVAAVVMLVATPGHAQPTDPNFFGNIDGGAIFPQGAISFADQVVDYSPVPVPGFTLHTLVSDPADALGPPDLQTADALACLQFMYCNFVSLGYTGSLTVQFTDNLLTPSGDDSDDLYIFETGPIIQGTIVEISLTGEDGTWVNLGDTGGGFRGIDIDPFVGASDVFRYVRLTDNGQSDAEDELGETEQIAGADIDAIGAISTTPVPLPPAIWLTLSGLVGLVAVGRRRSARSEQEGTDAA